MNRYRVLLPLLTMVSMGSTNALAADTEPTSNQLAQARTPASAAKPSETDARTRREAQLAARQRMLTSARNLIQAGKPADAYALLLPQQSNMAGDVEYDYLLGLAAIDSGKPNEAIFALERVLAVSPNHLQARAEIARAYLAAGELDASKQEFITVQQQNPPKEVSATIQKYLDIIETDRSGKASSIRGYVEFTVGHDSNVNTATSNKQIAVPFFGGAVMTMNDSGVANSDNFGSLGAGLNFRHSFNPEWAIVGGANVNQRNNSTQKTFNTGYADANFGLSRTDGNDNYMAVLQVQGFNLDGVRYRDAAGVSGQWQRNLDSGSQVGSYFQYTSLTYPDQTFRNADRYVLGGTYATPLASATPTIVYAGAYVGAEQARESNASYLGNTLFGGRVGGEMKLSAQYTLLASLSLESRMYGGDDPLFLTKRNDTQADLKAGINYMPAQQWTIGASIAYTSNDSNIAINKYDRTLFSVSLRRDFN